MGQTPGQTAEEGRDTSGWRLHDSPGRESFHCVLLLREREGQHVVVVLGVQSIWQVKKLMKTFTVAEQKINQNQNSPLV